MGAHPSATAASSLLAAAALMTVTLLAVACASDAAPTAASDSTTAPSPEETGPTPDAPPPETAPNQPADGPRDPATAEPAPDPPSAAIPAAPDADGPLTRAAWVHLFDGALKTRTGIEQVVADLVAADATAVIAEVVRRHDAYYRSDVLPRTTDPALEPGLDVLETLLEVARPAGLEVHAWVPVAPTWHASYDDLPAPTGWLPSEHGQGAPEAQRWVSRTVDGDWSEYLDPALPEVRDHLAAIVEELATDYPVDGIHLDYVRYASAQHGYHPRALARFKEETGTSAIPAPDDPTWSTWRRERTTDLLLAARAGVAASGNSPVLSVAVISWGDGPGGAEAASFADTRAATDALQDWEHWAEEGLVDVLLPMNYFREAETDQASWLRRWLTFEEELGARTGTRIVPGIAGYLNAPTDALTQVRLATEHTGAAAMYSYQQSTLDPDHSLWRELADTSWGAPAS